jgi:hypothetical protein
LEHVRNRKDKYGVKKDPVETFHNNIYIAPFPEDDIVGLVKMIGADRVVLGSDFPHPEGVPEPLAIFDEVNALSTDDLYKIAGETARILMSAN